ncbi:hypothetical protein I4F81_003845 [Pyropia yezoensis]|uniref:Uncharacterized protein n=1 Tax=Pyropia yezoensis TaxID=2788 RepID=A0ACC3BUW8_PYRYE|nr:hypothetical protein I4F81_003845 [Neopyropia yezoensis]|eukprot:contig_3742_g813
MTERYHTVATKFNKHPRAPFSTDHKHVKDRLQLLAKNFTALDKRRANQKGTEEDMTSTEQLLLDTVEEMNGHNERTATERAERTAAEGALVKNGEEVRRQTMEPRGAPAGPSAAVAGGGPREPGSPPPARRRTRPDDDDDAELVATLERSEARKQTAADREATLQERRVAHDQAALDVAHERRTEDTRARLAQEARVAADASAAGLERSFFIKAIQDLAKQRGGQ